MFPWKVSSCVLLACWKVEANSDAYLSSPFLFLYILFSRSPAPFFSSSVLFVSVCLLFLVSVLNLQYPLSSPVLDWHACRTRRTLCSAHSTLPAYRAWTRPPRSKWSLLTRPLSPSRFLPSFPYGKTATPPYSRNSVNILALGCPVR